MLQIFGDESHDSKNERVFTVAALFGSERQWDAFRSNWKERLGDRVFHASHCETGHGEFKNTAQTANLKLYADLTKILASSGLLGFGSAMDLGGYRDFFPDALDDVPYYRCFKDVIYQCGNWAKWAIPQEQATFNFDQRCQSDYNAAVLYEYMTRMPEWEGRAFLCKNINVVSRSEIGIQAADLYAREVMKHLDNMVGPVKRPTRRSLQALLETKRFGSDLHLRDYFQDFRRKFDDLASHVSMDRKQYDEWLSLNQQADSISSRHKYLIDVRQ